MFVANCPAMHLKDYLVISDLHLGITRELYKAGFSVPSQVKFLSGRLMKLKKITKAEKLVIIGDVKHNIPAISWQEMKELPEFLSLLSFEKVILVKGNHDGNIENLVNGLDNVTVRESFSVGDYFLTHGHRKIRTRKPNIVIGHNHPSVKLKDRMGAYYTLQCWLIGKIRLETWHKLILMPAFNPLSGSCIVNGSEKLMGPLAKNLSASSDVYLLDGTHLGKVKELRVD